MVILFFYKNKSIDFWRNMNILYIYDINSKYKI